MSVEEDDDAERYLEEKEIRRDEHESYCSCGARRQHEHGVGLYAFHKMTCEEDWAYQESKRAVAKVRRDERNTRAEKG